MKKRNARRKTALLLMVCMVLAAGCSRESGEAERIHEEYPTITLAYVGEEQKDLELVEEALNRIIQQEIKVNLDIIAIPVNVAPEQYKVLLSAGNSVDLIAVLFPYVNELLAEKLLLNLDEYIGLYGGAIKDKYKNQAKIARIGDYVYGVPVDRDRNTGTYILMRKDLLDKYQIDISKIHSLRDCGEVFAVIREKEPQMDILACSYGIGIMEKFGLWDKLTDSLGVLDYGGDETKVVNLFETEQFYEIQKVLYEFYQKGYISEENACTLEAVREQLRSGEVFSCILGTSDNTGQLTSRRVGYEMEAVKIAEGYQVDTQEVLFNAWSISANSRQPELAMQVLNYIYGSEEICNLLNWGIEGVHYVFEDEEQGIITYPDGVTAENIGYRLNATWIFPNAFDIYTWKGTEKKNRKEAEEINRRMKKSYAYGFIYDFTRVKDEVKACNEILDYYKNTLYNGLVDPDVVIPVMNEELEAAGLLRIIEEKQRQLDQWVGNEVP